ncbi:MAG TPA: XRE family transcriptional regulator [Terriglobales bacterium]|nr:XRE family transcriptional regulator [Terriglobales bacterium]
MPVPPNGRPEWAKKIEEMRDRLGLSQAALAKTLGVSPMAPSRWERGINRPPSSIFLRLGKLIGHPLCWYFWQEAGLSKEDLVSCADPAEVLARKLHIPASLNEMDYVALPLLPKEATRFDVPTATEKKDFMVARRDWCSHPDRTICWQYQGHGMKPLLADASIVAVDLSQSSTEDLDGKMVLATHPKHGPRIKWLLKTSEGLTLKPENPDVPSYRVRNGDWKIAGRVIWWFRKDAD